MTDCTDCRWAEMTPLEQGREVLRQALMRAFGLGPSPQTRALFSGIANTFAIVTGGKPRTWYDRHREEYEQTGNPAELARMLRHVS